MRNTLQLFLRLRQYHPLRRPLGLSARAPALNDIISAPYVLGLTLDPVQNLCPSLNVKP
ncbi:protein of unknown function [Methylocella tundrae]|uniref:Uncharacterized protein n=1 Tax=Methylocella tundrae TaxID=227605 RepID=A0A4U8Z0Q5_METTU|nr:protein of unknown function [Methylocella tundrae]